MTKKMLVVDTHSVDFVRRMETVAEDALRNKLLAGQISCDLHGLDDHVERNKNDKL